MRLPVIYNKPADFEHEFAICVSISFGNINKTEFIEWMEMYKIFGVTEVNIYDSGIQNTEIHDVFQHYIKEGVLNVIYMPPAVFSVEKNAHRLSSPASLNDCMMRNMYRYRYMIVVDLDEIIIPKLDKNYHDLLKHIDVVHKLDKPWISYTFRNAYFFKEFPLNATTSPNSMVLSQLYRAHVSARWSGVKSFVDPRHCESVFNHYCFKIK